MTDERRLERLSSPRIAAIDKRDAVLLLPLGCVEQHGPVAPTGSDTILAEHLSRAVADRLERVYVAPTLPHGFTPYGAVPGSVSLRPATLQALLEDVLEAYLAHGFRHLLVVNNHPQNEVAIEPAAAGIRRRHGVVVGTLYPWALAKHVSEDLYRDLPKVIGHGGEPTVSIMMALLPGALDGTATAPRGYLAEEGPVRVTSVTRARYEGFEVGLYNEPGRILPGGAHGDWTVGTPERGAAILERMVEYAVRYVPEFRRYSQRLEAGR